MADRSSDDPLILAARLYYLDGLSQPQIARLVNVSQAKVSRMLALARERGLVRITVPEYEPRHGELERRLKERFGLREAMVIRSTGRQPIEAVREAVGYFAAPPVAGLLDGVRSAAVAGGRTIHALVEHLRPAGARRGLAVLQAMGNIDSSPGPDDALELGRTLARRWEGSFLTLNTPALLPDAATRRRFLALPQIRDVMTQLAGVELALVGVGTPENSVFAERKALAAGDLAALRRAGAVGEILGRYFDAAGRPCATPLRERVISLELEALARVPEVIAVVSGSDRGPALRAAIAGGLIKSLVIDEDGAATLLDRD